MEKFLPLAVCKAEPEALPADASTPAADAPALAWFAFTSGIVDRDYEVLDPDGMEIDNFIRNAPALWGHDASIPAIGAWPKLVKGTDGKWRGGLRWADGNRYPFAGLLKYLYEDGIINAVSVRFIPKEWVDGDFAKDGFTRKFTKWELLEISLVNIPANPDALRVKAAADGAKGAPTDLFAKLFGEMIPGFAGKTAPLAAPPPAAEAGKGATPAGETGEKVGAELSKRNRDTLKTVRDALKSHAKALDEMLKRNEDGEDDKAAGDSPADPLADIKTALADIRAAIQTEPKPAGAAPAPEPATEKGTQATPGRREKTANPVELRELVRGIVAEQVRYKTGVV